MKSLVIPVDPGEFSFKKLLLHICCAPDAVYVLSELRKFVEIHGYFYNPNIHPENEYFHRLEETEKVCRHLQVPLITGLYDATRWFEMTRGLETEPEGGNRCFLCYAMRLEVTADEALKNNMDSFAAVLTISPHKNADKINQLGTEIGFRKGIRYIASNFKKKEGFKKSVKLSDELGLYRQKYCGCEFSITASCQPRGN